METSKNYPLNQAIWFFVITLGLSYFVFWGPLVIFRIPAASFVSEVRGPGWSIPLYILGGFVPSIVGIALTCVWEGKTGLRRLWSRAIQFRTGRGSYLYAILFTILITGGQIGLLTTLGGRFDFRLFVTQLVSFIPLFIVGPVSEEFGWRGFALDRLQTRLSGLSSAIVVGVVWSLWHLPLFFMIGTSQYELRIPFTSFLISVTASSILYTFLHNIAKGSIWMAIFFHWITTYCMQVVASGVTRSPTYNVLEPLPIVLLAIIVLIVSGPKLSGNRFS